MTENQKNLLTQILYALFSGVLSELDIQRANTLLLNWEGETPIWLRALAGGNPNALEKVREFVIEEFCRENLEALGYTVTLAKKDGGS